MQYDLYSNVRSCIDMLKGANKNMQTILVLAAACDNNLELRQEFIDYHKVLCEACEKQEERNQPITIRRDHAKDSFAVGERVALSYLLMQRELLAQVLDKCESINQHRAEKMNSRAQAQARAAIQQNAEDEAQANAAEAADLPPQPPHFDKRLAKLYLGSLDRSTTKEHILEALGPSIVKSATNPTNSSSDGRVRPKAFCFVEFFDYDGLEYALGRVQDKEFTINGQPSAVVSPVDGWTASIPKNTEEQLRQYVQLHLQYREKLLAYQQRMASQQQGVTTEYTTTTTQNVNQQLLQQENMSDEIKAEYHTSDDIINNNDNTMSDSLQPQQSIKVEQNAHDEWDAAEALAVQYNLPPVLYKGTIFTKGGAEQLQDTSTTIVILNMFTDEDKEEAPKEELIDEIRFECDKYGTIQIVDILFDSPINFPGDTVNYYPALIQYSQASETFEAFKKIHNRSFADRTLIAYVSNQ